MQRRLRTLAGISVFWIGLSAVGDAFLSIVVVAAVANVAPQDLTASAVGLLTFAGIIAAMLIQPVAGAVSDELRPAWGRRGQVVAGAVLVVLALAAFRGASGLPALAVAFLLVQVAASVAQAAQQGFIPDLVEKDWRGRAAGAKGFADLLGAFVGFALLAAVGGPDLGPAILAIAVLVAATAIAASWLVREPGTSRQPPVRRAALATAVARAFRLDVQERGSFVRITIARFLFLLATFTVGRFLLLIVGERLGIDAANAATATATLFAVLTLVTALGSIPAGWVADRRGRRGVMVAGAILAAAGCVLFLVAPDWSTVLVAGGILALGSAAFGSASWAWTTDLVVDGAAGRQIGMANLGTAGAAAFAGLFGPFIDVTRAYLPGVGFAAALVPAVVLFGVAAVVAQSVAERATTDAKRQRSSLGTVPSQLPEVPQS